ncbi:MAG: hypothetical protein LBB53_03795, partial [Prevotellaceae bacterium]|nr:hypothetical protein [Prevotellaceae bacterium]
MKQFFKKNINIVLFSLVATLFIGIAYTSADFFTAPAHEFSDRLILFFQWASIIIGILPVFYLMSLSKYVFAVFYPLICLLSSILMYFRYTIGTIFTTMIFDAVLDNDTRITGELISFWLVFIMIISVLIAGFFVIYRFKK